MQKKIYFSLLLSTLLFSDDSVVLDTLEVKGTTISDVAQEQIRSGDLTQTLQDTIPSISIVRRSGIANDIILRGQKKDNINVLVDGGKIYGACPNRMDPPTSHILTNNVASINVIEGPYDVENFGTLSGAVKITTKKPKEGASGSLDLNYGSFNYKKAALNVEGGSKKVKVLVSSSIESSDQYKDGSGNTLAEQLIKSTKNNPKLVGMQYKEADRSAYLKKTFMSKIYVDVSDTQELVASYTMNRSDNVLYPSTPMDAIYDNSDLLNLQYSLKNLASFSKLLQVKYYNSYVDHPMSNQYRKSSKMMGVIQNALTAQVQGASITNSADVGENSSLKIGLDSSLRNWNGSYSKNGIETSKSIDDTDTKNIAFFVESQIKLDAFDIKSGLRADYATIASANSAFSDNAYKSLSANVLATYNVSDSFSVFGGVAKASRVPDARELYFFDKDGKTMIGSDSLKQTNNYESDAGLNYTSENLLLKSKLFYSYLNNYIYFNSSKKEHKFENIDATIYGFEFSGTYYLQDDFYTDFAAAYQRGQKTKALEGQTDKDLAEIPPLKANITFNYEYSEDSLATLGVVGSDAWRHYDSDNGEQKLDAWAVVNAKIKHTFSKYFEGSLGVDNLLNKTYAISNTYNDLTLVGSGDARMLLNEPGRYVYANAKIKF